MKSSYIFNKIKKKINNDHNIFMVGFGDKHLISRYSFVRESAEEEPDDPACFYTCHPKTGLPAIYLYIKDPMFKDAFDKVIALVHEYGHFISFVNDHDKAITAGDNWHHFQNGKVLNAEQQKSVIEEEMRAWYNARIFLKKFLPNKDSRWKKFNNTKRRMLDSYYNSFKE